MVQSRQRAKRAARQLKIPGVSRSATQAPGRVARRKGRSRLQKEEAKSSTKKTEKLLMLLASQKGLEMALKGHELPSPDHFHFLNMKKPFTPFMELVAAMVVSRPLNHQQQMRALETLFNEPYNLRTPGDFVNAGQDTRWQALIDSHTHHKEKTAAQIGMMAETVVKEYAKDPSDGCLEKMRKGDLREKVSRIRGCGSTAIDVFCRRIQRQWREIYPFLDNKSIQAAEALGLPQNPRKLSVLVKTVFKKASEKDQRSKFCDILETMTIANLEGTVPQLVATANR